MKREEVCNVISALFQAAKRKLREEFLKHSDVTDEQRLGQVRVLSAGCLWQLTGGVAMQLVQEALEAEKFLREKVVQAVSTEDKVFSKWE